MFETTRSPEELGLSSKMLLNYLDDVKKRGLLMHSMMILKEGKEVAGFANVSGRVIIIGIKEA